MTKRSDVTGTQNPRTASFNRFPVPRVTIRVNGDSAHAEGTTKQTESTLRNGPLVRDSGRRTSTNGGCSYSPSLYQRFWSSRNYLFKLSMGDSNAILQRPFRN